MIAAACVALVFGIGIGFVLGLATYAHVYAHFLVREETRANNKVQRALADANSKRQQAEEVRRKLIDMYGSDLSARHAEVIDEEVERALGLGPNGGKR